MSHQPIEQSNVFREAKHLANQVWEIVREWESFSRWTVGRQLVSSLDSVAANLVEGDGRYSDADALHFFVISRGSLREAGYWLEVSLDRNLMPKQLSESLMSSVESIRRQLNGLINYRRANKNKNIVKEERAEYGRDDVRELDASRSTLTHTSLTPHAPNSEDLQFNAS